MITVLLRLKRARYPSVILAVALTYCLLAPSASGSVRRSKTAADWEMNERAGASVMHDSSGHGLAGRISPYAAGEGLTLHRSHYHWSNRCASCQPVASGRIVRVPDAKRLEIRKPPVPYTLVLRFRTTKPGGNYVEKGHSTTPGGQIKVQAWHGMVQCQFKGHTGVSVDTRSRRKLNDGKWHIVRCVHSASRVTEYVDGVKDNVAHGSTGYINNAKPFVIGGKLNCDQEHVGCDYFSGSMDYVRILDG